jgi:hypothetical protein
MTKKQRSVVVDSAAETLAALGILTLTNFDGAEEAKGLLIKAIKALQSLAKDAEG